MSTWRTSTSPSRFITLGSRYPIPARRSPAAPSTRTARATHARRLAERGMALVLVALDRSRHAATATEQHAAVESPRVLDDRGAEEPAPLHGLARSLARDRNQAHGGGLAVDPADRHLVGDDAGDRRHPRVAEHGGHVETHRAQLGRL